MTKVALSEIRHGKDDGEVVVVKEGDPVKGLPADVVKNLEALGVVAEEPKAASETVEELAEVTAERDALQKETEELRAQVAAAEAKAADAVNKGK